ncbi:hypothetical protein F511_06693 [Dorcoceras hygrometricum]|uniref:Uncharacterized protein n=1 Tax=Dorcoceras hygrometricum TaxID=472368 RepID=A0A2Z7B4H8_9LAMI|nr:hypothetical protein F511_06693 [Dorcoceras hygrometricum]
MPQNTNTLMLKAVNKSSTRTLILKFYLNRSYSGTKTSICSIGFLAGLNSYSRNYLKNPEEPKNARLAVGPQPLWLRNHNSGPAQRIMVKRLATSPHDPLGITDSACKKQSVVVSVQYGPFNPYIPIRSTTIDSIGYPRMSVSGESSTTMHRLLHASGSHPIPTPYDSRSTTGDGIPSSACTRRPDEIGADGFSSSRLAGNDFPAKRGGGGGGLWRGGRAAANKH